jgi:hypothetical protein
MSIARQMKRATGWGDDKISRIQEANTDILVIRRPLPVDCDSLLAHGRVGEVRFKMAARGAATKIGQGLDRLGMKTPARARARLADDIFGLVCGMLEVFDWPKVEVRLDLADTQSCPKFHCDNVLVRLVTTYAGPGTEYIETEAPDAVHRAAPGSLVFLKGHRHPTHGDAILHRSPPVRPGTLRFSVAIDHFDWLSAALR